MKTHSGIRVWKDHFTVVTKVGAEEPKVWGEVHSIPIELETLPMFASLIIDDQKLNDPTSDVLDVLTGEKSFREALGPTASAHRGGD
jgi:hypothetical protein